MAKHAMDEDFRFHVFYYALNFIVDAAIVKLTEPLVHVLCIVDNQHKPAMGFLYQAMYKAREKMVKRF